jgi:hypothetical protein
MSMLTANLVGEQLERETTQLYESLEQELPPCPCGGRFRTWSNVRCPHCRYEFPYNNGERNLDLRYHETQLVWVEGATAFRGSLMPSNKLVKVLTDRGAEAARSGRR